jgi:hypothetical protein
VKTSSPRATQFTSRTSRCCLPKPEAGGLGAARRREAERELASQFEFELQIVDLSQRFHSLAPDRVDDEIRTALARAAAMVRANCGYLVAFRPEVGQFDIYEWCATHVPERSRCLDLQFVYDETVLREVVQIEGRKSR